MAKPWATNLLHFHPNQLFKKWFQIWHYFVLQLFWLLLKKLGNFFPNHLVFTKSKTGALIFHGVEPNCKSDIKPFSPSLA